MFSDFEVALFTFGGYLIYRNFNLVKSFVLGYFKQHKQVDQYAIVKDEENYLVIYYNDKVIYLSKDKSIESAQCDYTFHLIKGEKVIFFDHPSGIPFMTNANILGVDRIVRTDLTEGDIVNFIGDTIPNYN